MTFFILPFFPLVTTPLTGILLPFLFFSGFPLLQIETEGLRSAEIEFLDYEPGGCGDVISYGNGQTTDWKCTAEVDIASMDQSVRFTFDFPTDSMILEVRYANGWGFLYSETEGGHISQNEIVYSDWLPTSRIDKFTFKTPNLGIYSPTSWEAIEPSGSKENAKKEVMEMYPLDESEIDIRPLPFVIEWRATVFRNGHASEISWQFNLRHGVC